MDKLDRDIARALGSGYKPIIKIGPLKKSKNKKIKIKPKFGIYYKPRKKK